VHIPCGKVAKPSSRVSGLPCGLNWSASSNVEPQTEPGEGRVMSCSDPAERPVVTSHTLDHQHFPGCPRGRHRAQVPATRPHHCTPKVQTTRGWRCGSCLIPGTVWALETHLGGTWPEVLTIWAPSSGEDCDAGFKVTC
jgi:hypothetical protein